MEHGAKRIKIPMAEQLQDPAEETLFGKDGNKALKSPSVHARSSNSNVAE